VTEAAAERRARLRLPVLTPVAFRRTAYAALAALVLVTVSGATVRLTGSGLGCDNWPRCGDTFLPETGYHAFVEFGNRVVGFAVGLTTLGAAFAGWRARIPRGLMAATLGLPLLVLAQGILGGITVIFELHPLIVMGHFLLSLAAVALAVFVCVGAERLVRGGGPAPLPRWVRWLAFGLVPLGLALVVSGAFVTAAGPHSGGSDIRRLGDLLDAVYVHVRVTAVFGVAFLALLFGLWRARAVARTEAAVAGITLGILLVQMAVGEAQWRNHLPWWLVLVHVVLATGVWTGLVTLAALVRAPGDGRTAEVS
jgi:cytochrome c oxidase assembly protein subunit 15